MKYGWKFPIDRDECKSTSVLTMKVATCASHFSFSHINWIIGNQNIRVCLAASALKRDVISKNPSGTRTTTHTEPRVGGLEVAWRGRVSFAAQQNNWRRTLVLPQPHFAFKPAPAETFRCYNHTIICSHCFLFRRGTNKNAQLQWWQKLGSIVSLSPRRSNLYAVKRQKVAFSLCTIYGLKLISCPVQKHYHISTKSSRR